MVMMELIKEIEDSAYPVWRLAVATCATASAICPGVKALAGFFTSTMTKLPLE
ncbi:hypothetical protein BDN71DRAFT_1451609 [Pleurotus eryngii]|uniref:Uncharacterized protein n=1 Tax=Pleurotus eryngii TaxID=5323 RepID=A0A9P6DD40_PLEER|nr:hypothetical protein BDN71DRAFT_1451609 [Pleurotus eryngii]